MITVLTLAAGLFFYAPWLILLLLAVAHPALWSARRSSTPGPTISAGALAGAARARISALDRRQRRDRQGDQAVRARTTSSSGASSGWPTRSSSRTASCRSSARSGAALFAALSTLTYYGAYAYIVWRTLEGEFTHRRPRLPVGLLPQAQRPVRADPDRLHPDRRPVALSRRSVLLLRDRADHPLSPAPEAVPAADPRGHRLRECRLPLSRTPSAGPCADLNFTLKAGETLALVGENGAGKTTIVKLLTRLYDPDEGRITIDGIDLRDFAVEDLRDPYRRHLPGFHPLQPSRPPTISASAASRPSSTASASRPPPSRASPTR